jgi:hypothetical protein
MPASKRTIKSRRITRACDYCHQRSIRCINAGGSQCQKCIEFDQPCTYERAVKRRGVKPKSGARAGSPASAPRNFESANSTLDRNYWQCLLCPIFKMCRNLLTRLVYCLNNCSQLLTAPSAPQVIVSAMEGSDDCQPSRGHESRRGIL